MSVYFAYSLRGNLLKIGCSDEPQHRIPAVQKATGLNLRLILMLPGHYKEEKIYHRWFTQERAGGEFFHLEGAVLGFIMGWAEARAVLSGMEVFKHRTVFHEEDVPLVVSGDMRKELRTLKLIPCETRYLNKPIERAAEAALEMIQEKTVYNKLGKRNVLTGRPSKKD